MYFSPPSSSLFILSQIKAELCDPFYSTLYTYGSTFIKGTEKVIITAFNLIIIIIFSGNGATLEHIHDAETES